jgi:hypothetical protein
MINKLMELEKESNQNGHGGAREGSGRKPGTTQKITAKEILSQCEAIVGKPLAVSILEGYRDTILDGDRKQRVIYEKMLLDKTSSTLFEGEITESEDAVASKKQAFMDALATLSSINKQQGD